MADPSKINQELLKENTFLKQRIKELEKSESECREAEKALRESEARFEQLSDITREGIVIHHKGVLIDANRAFSAMFGYELSEVMGKKTRYFAAPESLETIRCNILSDYQKPYKAIGMRKDKTKFPLEIVGKSVPYSGKMCRVATIRCITEHEMSEEVLRESEERYRAISEYSHNAISIFDEQGKFIWCNSKMKQLGGYSLEHLYGAESFIEFLAPESLEFVVSNFQKVVAGEPYEHHYTFYLIRADGEKRLIEKYMTDFKDKHGKRNLITSMLDITERKLAEEALRASKEHFEQLFNMSPYGIALSRMSDGLILDANDAWIKRAGFKRDEIIGKTFLELNIFENPADRQKLVNELKEKGFSDKLETPCRMKDGSRIIARLSAGLIELNGSPHIISTMIDITEQKRIDQEIQEEKTRFEALFSANPQATVLSRLSDGLLVDFNDGFTDILGYTRDEAIGKTVIECDLYTNPADRQNIVNELIEKGICRNYEAVFRMKNGGTMVGLMSAKVIT